MRADRAYLLVVPRGVARTRADRSEHVTGFLVLVVTAVAVVAPTAAVDGSLRERVARLGRPQHALAAAVRVTVRLVGRTVVSAHWTQSHVVLFKLDIAPL